MRLLTMLLGLWAVTALADQVSSPALEQIVDTERAFARASVRHGHRDAFLTYLADDGITFSPNPARGPEGIRKRPQPPPSAVLNWAPMYGGVSHGGDLGFTTGPYAVTDMSGAKPPRYGIYLTVWLLHPHGRYLVDFDAGISTPSAVAPLDRIMFTPIANIGAHAPESPRPRKARLWATDRRYNEAIKAQGWAKAAAGFQRTDARVHIDGAGPLASRTEIDKWLGRQPSSTLHTVGQRSSAAEDLGYVYGRYNSYDDTVRGWYVRLWTREPKAEWRVLIETFLPLPPG